MITYEIDTNNASETANIVIKTDGSKMLCIPFYKGNTDYEEYLEWIANGGDTTGTVPSSVQKDADDWLFNKQLNEYVTATERLELDAVVASDDIPATIEVSTTNPETMEVTTETVANPVIVKDEQERASAQAVVDATPQPVIDSLG
jgi:hypothetical protein